MWPDLSYFFHDLFGTARDNWTSVFKTYGLLLLLSFLAAARLLKWELKRRENIGQLRAASVARKPGAGLSYLDYAFNGFFGFVLGFKLPYALGQVEAWKADPSGVLLSTKGNLWTGLLAAAAFLGYYYYLDQRAKRAKPQGSVETVYPSDRIAPITFAAAIGGLVGAKIFAIIEYLPQFFADPIGTFFSGSGLAIYGGLIGGFLAVFWYLNRHQIDKLPLMDAVAPALMVAYGVGRIGCQLSGDGDWGILAAAQPEWWFLPDWLWAYDYPHNVVNGGDAPVELIEGCTDKYCTRLAQGHYPTPLYETTAAFALGGLLWGLRRRLTAWPGLLFSVYLMVNGIERFFIEFIRVNDTYNVFGLALTQAQLIAIGFMAAGGVMAWWVKKRPMQVLSAN
ncbi:MAG: prolipoprotein diacylglyceryl transferase [Lewinella sp.]|nr:prolipoprotein diacylglyceryl transferase [Lewinella sp.]